MLHNRAMFGLLGAASVLLLSAVGASAQTFSFTTALSDATAGDTTIASGQINTTNAANFFTFNNGFDAAVTPASFGSAVVLTSYNTTATSATTGTVSTGFSNLISLTQGGVTQTATLTGTYGGGANSGAALLTQTFNQSSLSFVFANGTYVLNGFNITSPGGPGGSPGATGATVTFTASAAAPEPGSVALLGTGLVGMAGMIVRRKKSA